MHFAKPIIAFNCGYNRASMEGKGAYFKDGAELKQRVAETQHSHDPEMREIALRKYSWDIVKQKYLDLFD
jgi:glycosyltransferase involved in cell wall biosynthesis